MPRQVGDKLPIDCHGGDARGIGNELKGLTAAAGGKVAGALGAIGAATNCLVHARPCTTLSAVAVLASQWPGTCRGWGCRFRRTAWCRWQCTVALPLHAVARLRHVGGWACAVSAARRLLVWLVWEERCWAHDDSQRALLAPVMGCAMRRRLIWPAASKRRARRRPASTALPATSRARRATPAAPSPMPSPWTPAGRPRPSRAFCIGGDAPWPAPAGTLAADGCGSLVWPQGQPPGRATLLQAAAPAQAQLLGQEQDPLLMRMCEQGTAGRKCAGGRGRGRHMRPRCTGVRGWGGHVLPTGPSHSCALSVTRRRTGCARPPARWRAARRARSAPRPPPRRLQPPRSAARCRGAARPGAPMGRLQRSERGGQAVLSASQVAWLHGYSRGVGRESGLKCSGQRGSQCSGDGGT